MKIEEALARLDGLNSISVPVSQGLKALDFERRGESGEFEEEKEKFASNFKHFFDYFDDIANNSQESIIREDISVLIGVSRVLEEDEIEEWANRLSKANKVMEKIEENGNVSENQIEESYTILQKFLEKIDKKPGTEEDQYKEVTTRFIRR